MARRGGGRRRVRAERAGAVRGGAAPPGRGAEPGGGGAGDGRRPDVAVALPARPAAQSGQRAPDRAALPGARGRAPGVPALGVPPAVRAGVRGVSVDEARAAVAWYRRRVELSRTPAVREEYREGLERARERLEEAEARSLSR